jgi:hypothetical protein
MMPWLRLLGRIRDQHTRRKPRCDPLDRLDNGLAGEDTVREQLVRHRLDGTPNLWLGQQVCRDSFGVSVNCNCLGICEVSS